MVYSHPFFLAALVLYVLSAGLYHALVLVRSDRNPRAAQVVAFLGFLLHSAAIIDRSIELGHAPYVELREAVATIAWTVVLLTLIVEWRRKTASIGVFAMPLAVFLMLMADTLPVFGASHPLVPAIYENPLKAHIGAIVVAFAGFGLAFCAAVMYLVQERRLKEKRVLAGHAGTLSLVEIEEMANHLAAFGFSMLTLGLVLGSVWAGRGLWKGHWYVQPIVLTTVATWGIYAAYLWLRSVRGSRGRGNMYYLIAGFSLAVVTVLIIRVLVPGQHGF